MLALIAFVELEVTLTAIVTGVSLRGRSPAVTFAATGIGAVATVAGLWFVWMVWFVAPWCIADSNLVGCTADRAGAGSLVYVTQFTILEWAWMLGVALLARYVAGRNLGHVSG